MFVILIIFFIGCIVISGILFLVGFWSKDEIFGQVFNSYLLFWVVGFLIVGMMVFYMFCFYFFIFEGEFCGNDIVMQVQLFIVVGKDFFEYYVYGGVVLF